MNPLPKAILTSFLVILIGLLGLGAYWTYNHIFVFASLSVGDECGQINDSQLNSMGYALGGQYDPNTDKITMNQTDPRIFEISKHENCHMVQAHENRLWSCSNRVMLWTDECECYISEYLPGWIYHWRYG